MNWSNIETGWNDFKANAKQQWSKLSDQQINDTQGKRERRRAAAAARALVAQPHAPAAEEPGAAQTARVIRVRSPAPPVEGFPSSFRPRAALAFGGISHSRRPV